MTPYLFHCPTHKTILHAAPLTHCPVCHRRLSKATLPHVPGYLHKTVNAARAANKSAKAIEWNERRRAEAERERVEMKDERL